MTWRRPSLPGVARPAQGRLVQGEVVNSLLNTLRNAARRGIR
jgi:hypothetical protein